MVGSGRRHFQHGVGQIFLQLQLHFYFWHHVRDGALGAASSGTVLLTAACGQQPWRLLVTTCDTTKKSTQVSTVGGLLKALTS